MCFSATASFVAGVSLSVFGMTTLKRAQQRNEVPFALIPLLFGIQQLIEGMLWLSFRFDAPWLNASTTYAFSLFSHVVWPIFIPYAVKSIETVAWRKNILSVFQIIGIAVGVYLLYFIARFQVTSEVHENIVYVSVHFYNIPVMLLYIAATCASSFFSSHRIINFFGALALLFGAAYWFYTAALLSVWCFFAAILSIIYLHFRFRSQNEAGMMSRRA